MKKFVACLVGVSLVLVLGSVSMAQPKAGLEIHGLYGFKFSDKDAELEKGWGGGASLVLCLGELVKLDIGGDYIRPEMKDQDGIDFGGNYVQLIPVTGTLRIGPNLGPVYIYGGGGAGYSFNSLDLKKEMNPGDDLELENCFTYHACAGLEVSFTESKAIGLRAEFRYMWLKPKLKEKSTGDKESQKLDNMQGRAGLVFYF
ncbi:MAG: outer membrane beta-barrel protein [Candidatus Euphemobacter frigidus]|nr:outer membrane beta-barrel protein [Candidatus Euphemobacter frigidus]MDP8275209.1 outer membrane beta-barrel protein [Candidatus Euphemobacter frigidus]